MHVTFAARKIAERDLKAVSGRKGHGQTVIAFLSRDLFLLDRPDIVGTITMYFPEIQVSSEQRKKLNALSLFSFGALRRSGIGFCIHSN